MTNKILDHIEHVILEGTRRPAPRGIDFKLEVMSDPAPLQIPTMEVQFMIRGELRVFYEQHLDERASAEHRHRAKERAKSSIARHLYEDVLSALRDIREEVWSEGIQASKAETKLNALIDDLSGRMGRFE